MKAPDFKTEARIRELPEDVRRYLGDMIRNGLQHVQDCIELERHEEAINHIEYLSLELKRVKL